MYIEIRQHRIVGTLERIVASSWNVRFVPGSTSAVTTKHKHLSHRSDCKRYLQKTLGVVQCSEANWNDRRMFRAAVTLAGRLFRMFDMID